MAILIIGGIVVQNPELLRDQDSLRLWVPEMCRQIDMKPVGDIHIQPYGHWEGGAPSAVQFVEESAVLVHTYPELDYVELILHSCKPIYGEGFSHGIVTKAMVDMLHLKVRARTYLGDFNWRELAKWSPKR